MNVLNSTELKREVRSAAFTLIELLVALAIMTLVCGACFLLLSTVTKAWQRGTALSKDLHAGDFVIEQLVGALRSARYRNINDGLILKKSGTGSAASDSITWVKEGSDLVGVNSYMAKTLHHVRFNISQDKDGKRGAAYTAWGDEYLQPEDFDPDSLEPEVLSDRVVGLSIRVATNDFENEKIEWMDEWEGKCDAGGDLTNHLPRFVEITLFLQPLDEESEPLEMKRLVDIPIAKKGIK
jgi:prepilin-type N-terminal cleavage/methylation domain-containing protein